MRHSSRPGTEYTGATGQTQGDSRESSDDSSDEMSDVHVPGLLDSPIPDQVIAPHHHFQHIHSTPMNLAYPGMIPPPVSFGIGNITIQDFTKSFPVFDMRLVHRLQDVQFQKIKAQPGFSTEQLKKSISSQFETPVHTVQIIEEAGKKEGALMKTLIIILPEKVLEKCYTLIFECYSTAGQPMPQMICARLPVTMKITEVKKLLGERLKWKTFALCSNKCVLPVGRQLQNCSLKDFDRIQAVSQSVQQVTFCHKPRADVQCYYHMDINTCKSVKEIKDDFEQHFGGELDKQKVKDNYVLHFCFKGNFIADEQCVGLVLAEDAYGEGIMIYFAPEDSINVVLQYKHGRKQKQQQMIIAKQTSTAELRFEATKYLNVDPKAVKLTFEKKFIDEHENLYQVYGEKWKNGIILVAGIKKRKTIRIKHPISCDEKAFEMYMLEPVSVLKDKIADEWGLNHLEISLYLRETMMINWQPLQFYPIKNNMEIDLQLYPQRIEVKIVILKRKEKITLIVNDYTRTTVDELLTFCAHKFNYARQSSRGIYKERCLKRDLTLEQEGIQSDDTIVIAYFDYPCILQGALINIFMVRPDGHTVKRIGSVNSGILLHAPKCTSAPVLEDYFDNGPVPTGIYVSDSAGIQHNKKPTTVSKKSGVKRKSKLVLEQALQRKPELLRRARSLTETRRREQHRLVKQTSEPQSCGFYLSENEEISISDTTVEEYGLSENTERKVPYMYAENVDSNCGHNKEISDETDCNTSNVTNDEGSVYLAETSECDADTLYQRPNFSSLLSEDQKSVKFKYEENTGVKPKVSLDNTKESSNYTKDSINYPKDLSNYFEHTKRKDEQVQQASGNETAAALSVDKSDEGDIVQENIKQYSERESLCDNSKDECSDTGYDDQQHRDTSQTTDNSTPSHHKSWQIERLQRQGLARVHTSSEGSERNNVMVRQPYAMMNMNQTCPVVPRFDSNSHLHTAGITRQILLAVGQRIGNKWRMLLRTLGMNEDYLDHLEYQHTNHGLEEIGYQAMVAWKQAKGSEASLEKLVTALESVGMKAIAEHYCTSGFHTT